MKKSILILLALMLTAPMAFAEESSTPAGITRNPCAKIIQACEAAGYIKGGSKREGKSLNGNCVKPLLAGQSVPGVSMDSAVIQACQDKQKARAQSSPQNPK